MMHSIMAGAMNVLVPDVTIAKVDFIPLPARYWLAIDDGCERLPE